VGHRLKQRRFDAERVGEQTAVVPGGFVWLLFWRSGRRDRVQFGREEGEGAVGVLVAAVPGAR
jgi:hypothetical protein